MTCYNNNNHGYKARSLLQKLHSPEGITFDDFINLINGLGADQTIEILDKLKKNLWQLPNANFKLFCKRPTSLEIALNNRGEEATAPLTAHETPIFTTDSQEDKDEQ